VRAPRVGLIANRPGEHHDDRAGRSAVAVAAQAAGDEPGVQRVGGDAGSREAPGQLAGEVDVGQLRAVVGGDRPVEPLGLQVVEVEPVAGSLVGARRHDHDPGGGAGAQVVHQQGGQEEVAEVVDAERRLEAVLGEAVLGLDQPRVVDQHVEVLDAALHLVGAAANRREARQVEVEHLDRRARGGGSHLVGGRLTLGRVPGGDDDPGAEAGQPAGGGETHAGVAARHEAPWRRPSSPRGPRPRRPRP